METNNEKTDGNTETSSGLPAADCSILSPERMLWAINANSDEEDVELTVFGGSIMLTKDKKDMLVNHLNRSFPQD